MDESGFWELIGSLEWRHEGNDELVIKPVVTKLAAMPLEAIESFEEILAQKLYALDGRAWAREIGTAWWGGDPPVSVDKFLYARCAVVANGKEFYESVLADPAMMPKDVEFEALLIVGRLAWEARTGVEPSFLTKVSYETYSNQAGWPPAPPDPERPRPAVGEEIQGGARKYDYGKLATRRIIRALLTGELREPFLDDYLTRSSRRLVMTPGTGVEPPREPDDRHQPWIAEIDLWASAPDASPQPTGLVARVELSRISAFDVRGRLIGVGPRDPKP